MGRFPEALGPHDSASKGSPADRILPPSLVGGSWGALNELREEEAERFWQKAEEQWKAHGNRARQDSTTLPSQETTGVEFETIADSKDGPLLNVATIQRIGSILDTQAATMEAERDGVICELASERFSLQLVHTPNPDITGQTEVRYFGSIVAGIAERVMPPVLILHGVSRIITGKEEDPSFVRFELDGEKTSSSLYINRDSSVRLEAGDVSPSKSL